jgi:hypothetical protein
MASSLPKKTLLGDGVSTNGKGFAYGIVSAEENSVAGDGVSATGRSRGSAAAAGTPEPHERRTTAKILHSIVSTEEKLCWGWGVSTMWPGPATGRSRSAVGTRSLTTAKVCFWHRLGLTRTPARAREKIQISATIEVSAPLSERIMRGNLL